jgi:arylsulfatase
MKSILHKSQARNTFTSVFWLTNILTFLILLGFGNFVAAASDAVSVKNKRPNILLIVADDLGYSDLGAYGGEISTPNLNSLATQGGIQLTNFHVAPTCSPTRSMLMSGTYNHLAGLGSMAEWVADNQKDQPGYEGYLNERVVSLPSRLKEAGYATLMTGKWHLGMKPGQGPETQGFEQSYAMLPGAGNHYTDQGLFPFLPVTPYRENGKPVSLPNDFYSTDFYTDKTIEYIDKVIDSSAKPFFAYVAYTSPHWPLQVDKKYSDKYSGRYDKGYENIQNARLQTMSEMNLFTNEIVTTNKSKCYSSWDQLPTEEQKRQARIMEVYAGMVDSLDDNIGKLIQHLKDIGEYDNTFIVFMSDNGADARPEGGLAKESEFMQKNYNNSYENIGAKDSFVSYGGAWAQVSSTPFRLHKGMTTEGGIVAPAIFHYPKGNLQSGVTHEFVSVMDLLPTFLELAEVDPSAITLQSKDTLPVAGKSIVQYLKGKAEKVHQDHLYGFSVHRRQGLQYNDWKIVRLPAPYGNQQWMLFNLKSDPGEVTDLADREPTVLQDMIQRWASFAEETGVIIASADSNTPSECESH